MAASAKTSFFTAFSLKAQGEYKQSSMTICHLLTFFKVLVLQVILHFSSTSFVFACFFHVYMLNLLVIIGNIK